MTRTARIGALPLGAVRSRPRASIRLLLHAVVGLVRTLPHSGILLVLPLRLTLRLTLVRLGPCGAGLRGLLRPMLSRLRLLLALGVIVLLRMAVLRQDWQCGRQTTKQHPLGDSINPLLHVVLLDCWYDRC